LRNANKIFGADRLSYPARLALLAVAMPVDTFTGVVLGLTTREPFPAYTQARRSWGPSLVGDLHLGGAVMWVAGDGLMVAMMAALAVAFVRSGTGGAGAGRWVEAARAATLADHTAAAGLTPHPGLTGSVDDDAHVDAHRYAYNTWLASLDQHPTAGRDRPTTTTIPAEPAAPTADGKGRP
jgi:putative copper resistance protein D